MTPFEVSVVPTTAITDLLDAALLLVAYLLLRRRLPREQGTSRYLLRFASMAGISCFLGFLTHIYCWGFGMMFVLWFVLSISIIETAHSFFILAAYTLSDGQKPSKKQMRGLRLLELIMLLLLVAFMLNQWHPIQPIVVFAILLVVPGLCFLACLAFRGHVGARIFSCFIVPLLPCLVFQLMGLHEEIVFGNFNFDGLSHLFIMLDIPIIFVAALKWRGVKEKTVV